MYNSKPLNAHAFAINLRKIRKDRNITQAELAKAINVQKSSISNYEKSVSVPDIPKVLEIAKVLQIDDLNMLFGYIPENTVAESEENNRYIPIVERVSCDMEPTDSANVIDRMMLPNINLKSGNFFGYIVPDNSMSRSKIRKGDIAIIRRQSNVSTGDIVLVAEKSGKSYLRKLYMLNNNSVVSLQPDSDDSGYLPITYDLDDENYRIFGRVSYMHISF